MGTSTSKKAATKVATKKTAATTGAAKAAKAPAAKAAKAPAAKAAKAPAAKAAAKAPAAKAPAAKAPAAKAQAAKAPAAKAQAAKAPAAKAQAAKAAAKATKAPAAAKTKAATKAPAAKTKAAQQVAQPAASGAAAAKDTNGKKVAGAPPPTTASSPSSKKASSKTTSATAPIASPTSRKAAAKSAAPPASLAVPTSSAPAAAAPAVIGGAAAPAAAAPVVIGGAAAPAAAAPAPAAAAPAAAPAPANDTPDASGTIQEATLNWTDLTGAKTGATALGSNKFYKARITQAGGQFLVTFSYGRVGQAGQVTTERASSLEGARRIFQSKINSKIKKGYRPLEMRSERDELAKAQTKGITVEKPKPTRPSRSFHPQVEKLLEIMYTSAGQAVQKGLSSSAGASSAAPLGNLHDSQLDKGADLLDAIDALLAKPTKPPRSQFIELTNEYLSNIPRNIDKARRGSTLDLDMILLDREERVAKERDFLSLLRDLHLQKEVFAAAALSDSPYEVWYEGLRCELEHVESGTDEYEKARVAFDEGQSPKNVNFYGKLKVLRVWRVEREGEKPSFQKYADTITAKPAATGIIGGWHGTRTENLMGISRSGLLMPENLPKGVVTTGKAFGMGIYHAPRWPDAGKPREAEDGQTYTRYNGALKSMNYTSLQGAHYGSGNTSRLGYLFLEEVALGVPEVHLTACWGRARPADGHDYIYAKAFGNPQLAHDEIVTFHEDASRLTHLLEIGVK